MLALDEIPRTIGALEAKIERLEKDVSHLLDKQMEILEILQQAKGGWKVMVGVGSAAAAVGAIATKATSWLIGAR